MTDDPCDLYCPFLACNDCPYQGGIDPDTQPTLFDPHTPGDTDRCNDPT